MRPRVITPPASEPLSVEDMAAHLRLGDDASELSYVQKLIRAVRSYLEHRLGRAFVRQTLEITLDYWTGCDTWRYGGIELPWAWPLISVDSITYTDSDGAVVTMDPAEYLVNVDSLPGWITTPYGETWPSFTPHPVSAIRIRYTAGYDIGGSPEVPFPDEDILHSMRLLVSHFFVHREAVIVGESFTIESRQMELAVDSLLVNHDMERPNVF